MTAKIIQFAERSPEKINQKYFDAFFEQLKAGVSCGTVEGHGPSDRGRSLDKSRALGGLRTEALSEYQASSAGKGYVNEDGGWVPEDEKEKEQ